MCKVGDIILVDEYKHGDTILKKHSFIVLDIDGGEIHSVEYDMICNVMGSFHDEDHRAKKLRHSGNIEIFNDETDTNPDNGKDGYVKANQLYYFNKEKLPYRVIGNVIEETLERLVEYINKLAEENKLVNITDNL